MKTHIENTIAKTGEVNEFQETHCWLNWEINPGISAGAEAFNPLVLQQLYNWYYNLLKTHSKK